MSPKSNNKSPYEKNAEGDLRWTKEEKTRKRGGSTVAVETEIAEMWPQVKECRQPREDESGKEQTLCQELNRASVGLEGDCSLFPK